MIGINDIREAVMKLLKNQYTEINVHGEESQQSFKRPAFFVDVMPDQGAVLNAAHREKNMTIEIVYYPVGKKPNNECWQKNSELDEIFLPVLEVGDRCLTIQDKESDVEGQVLYYQFNLEFIDSKEVEETHAPMEELHLNGYQAQYSFDTCQERLLGEKPLLKE